MMSTNAQPARFPLLRNAMALILASAIVFCVIETVLLAFRWRDHTWACAIAAALCCGVGVIALLPLWFLARCDGTQGAAIGFLAGIVLRILLCGGGLIILQRTTNAGDRILAMWIGAWYLIELSIEVGLVGRYLKRLPIPKPA